MGDYFADFLDVCFEGLEVFFDAFWDAIEVVRRRIKR